MQTPEERIAYLRRFADALPSPLEADLAMVMLRSLANRKRTLFPHDSRMIVDFKLEGSGDVLCLTPTVVKLPESTLTDDVEVPEPMSDRVAHPLEELLLAPLLALESGEYRELVVQHAIDLTRAHANVVAAIKREEHPDDERVIAMCEVRGTPGTLDLTVYRWPRPFSEARIDWPAAGQANAAPAASSGAALN